ncbi:MAG: glycosyltransferase [Pseudoxanthomonas sp.]
MHDRLLEAAGTSVNGVHGPADAWFDTTAAEQFLPPMRQLLETEFAGAGLFVFKDPRSALVFPLWRRVLADLGMHCRPVLMVRPPQEVAASLVARQAAAVPWQSWTDDRAGLLWLRYMLAAERHTRGDIRAFCSYDGLLNDWQAVARRLAEQLDLVWPRAMPQAAPDIGSFLDAAHRHQHAARRSSGRSAIWSSWIDPAFDALIGAGAGTGTGPNRLTLDSIGQSFADACAALRPTRAPDEGDERDEVKTSTAIAPREIGARRRVCLVVNADSVLDPDRYSSLAALLDALVAAQVRITLLSFGRFAATASRARASLTAGRSVEVQACSPDQRPVEPAFMGSTIELFRHLRRHRFDVVFFPDAGGPAYACTVARQAGLAFAETTLAVVALGGSRWRRERDRRFPGDLVTLSIEHLEQQAIERADVVLLPSPQIAAWMRQAGWHWRGEDPAHRPEQGALQRGVMDALKPLRATSMLPVEALRPSSTVTVVISHFERPQLLEQALQALAHQTDRDFSVVVVDDGSQHAGTLDYLADVEQRHGHLGLRLVRQVNRYLGAARNAGIRAATTEFVILLDDDNLAFPALVATLRRAAQAMEADVVTCGIRHFHDATGTPEAGEQGDGPDQFFAGGPLLVGAVHNCFGDASGIYRRAIFEQLGDFHEQRGVTYEDWQMHLRAASAGLRLFSLPEPLVWYRVSNDSMLRTTHRYDNAGVIASTVRTLPGAALEPLAQFLIGQEDERVRQNFNVEAVRAVCAAHAAALSDLGDDAAQRASALEQMLVARSRDARSAEDYAQSLTRALAQARSSLETAGAYARSLEAARVKAETYARDLEAELLRLRDDAARPPPPAAH